MARVKDSLPSLGSPSVKMNSKTGFSPWGDLLTLFNVSVNGVRTWGGCAKACLKFASCPLLTCVIGARFRKWMSMPFWSKQEAISTTSAKVSLNSSHRLRVGCPRTRMCIGSALLSMLLESSAMTRIW